MKKILIVCGNGLGSSFMLEMKVKKVADQLGIKADIDHTDLTTAKSSNADLFLGAKDVIAVLADSKDNVEGLINILSEEEIKGVLQKHF